jgi:hypothetical protein
MEGWAAIFPLIRELWKPAYTLRREIVTIDCIMSASYLKVLIRMS